MRYSGAVCKAAASLWHRGGVRIAIADAAPDAVPGAARAALFARSDSLA